VESERDFLRLAQAGLEYPPAAGVVNPKMTAPGAGAVMARVEMVVAGAETVTAGPKAVTAEAGAVD